MCVVLRKALLWLACNTFADCFLGRLVTKLHHNSPKERRSLLFRNNNFIICKLYSSCLKIIPLRIINTSSFTNRRLQSLHNVPAIFATILHYPRSSEASPMFFTSFPNSRNSLYAEKKYHPPLPQITPQTVPAKGGEHREDRRARPLQPQFAE